MRATILAKWEPALPYVHELVAANMLDAARRYCRGAQRRFIWAEVTPDSVTLNVEADLNCDGQATLCDELRSEAHMLGNLFNAAVWFDELQPKPISLPSSQRLTVRLNGISVSLAEMGLTWFIPADPTVILEALDHYACTTTLKVGNLPATLVLKAAKDEYVTLKSTTWDLLTRIAQLSFFTSPNRDAPSTLIEIRIGNYAIVEQYMTNLQMVYAPKFTVAYPPLPFWADGAAEAYTKVALELLQPCLKEWF